MTSISKLTQNSSVNDSDLFVIWDSDNSRTRSITAKTLYEYTDQHGVNSSAFVSGKIEDNTLIMTTASGEDVTIGDVDGINISAQPDEVVSYDAAQNKFIGTGVFAKDGEITASTNTFNLGGAWSISSSGDVVSLTNKSKDISYIVKVGSFSKLGNPEEIVNREFVQNFNPNTVYSDEITNLVFPNIPITPINQSDPEDGHIAEFLDFRLGPSSVKTNIKIDTYISDVLFDSSEFAEATEIETGIYRFYFKTPIVYAVGDVIRTETTSTDGNVTMMGDLSTMRAWLRFDATLFDIKKLGLNDSDVKSLDTDYDNSVLTTKITLNDDTELESSSTITVSGVDTNVDGNESAFILTGDHLSSSYDATTKTTILIGEDPNPPATIVDFDVSQDNTILLDNTFSGKVANLIQSVQSQTLATITLSGTSVFDTGDVIKIQASDTYLYHFFRVYYTEGSGQQLVAYPAKNVTLIKTNSGWNVEEGGRFNRVAIRPGSASGTPIAGDDPTIDNVQVISVIQSQAAEIISDGNGNSALQFDFSKLDGTSIIDDSGTATDKTYSSSKIVDVVAESSPYKIYQSISDIESDFGPITITPLDGVNDDQIRSNNCVNVLDAIGNKAEANLVIGSDTSLAPITYCELMFRSHNTQRTSITAISKNSSDMWVFSASVGDAGSDTSSRWYQAYMLGKELDMQGQEIINANDISIDNSGTTSIYSTNHPDQSINYFNSGDISIGAVSAVDIGINGVVKQSFVSDALDMKGTTVKNIADGVNDQDAVSKTQSEAFVSGEFEKASNALVEGNSSEVNLKDSTRSNGYGNPSEKINYLPIADNTVVVPDTSYGNMWFIHEKTGTSNGYLMIHKDLLSSFVDSSTQKIPFFINSVQGALGMSNQIATDEASDSSARWNCTAGAIQSFDDANSLPPPHNYYDQQARKGAATQRSSALSATYSPGRTEIIGNSYLERAEIKNVDDDSVQVLPNPTGDWFVVRVTTGGGTFAVKKVFQWFPREYADFFYSAEDFSLALGLKVDNNAIRIGELERVSDTTPVEQDPDSNGVVETISLPAAINNRIDLDVGQTKTLNVGYQNNQVNLVAYDVIIKSMVTDTNDTNYGRNFEIKGAIVRSNGLISFIKSQATGESLNLNISVAMIDEHIQVTLTGAPCKLSINTKAVVKR